MGMIILKQRKVKGWAMHVVGKTNRLYKNMIPQGWTL